MAKLHLSSLEREMRLKPTSAACTLGLLVLAVTAPVMLMAQSMTTQPAMHARILSLYSFSPSKVSGEIRTSKSKQMDEFWSEITLEKNVELPLLRKELENNSDPPFFFEDGSGLLLSLSQAPDDLKLAAGALARSDLSDVATRQYLYQVHSLAVKGVDVTPAALHILDDSTFKVFLPEHGAFELDQSACLLELLLPLPNDFWLQAVIGRFRTEHDITALKSLLLILFYAQDDEADRVILSATGPESSREIREAAKAILSHEKDLGIGKNPSRSTEAKLREQRRTRMFAISDEAMDDLEPLTKEIARSRAIASQK